MQNTEANRSDAGPPLGRLSLYFGSIRIWESLFALPFAYIGMALASQSLNGQPWPGWSPFIWITVAMFGARTLGMSANRLIHAKEDSANPRTADRHLPSGLLKSWEVSAMAIVGLLILFLGASQLNPLALLLSPLGRRLRCLLLLRQVLHLALQLLPGLGPGYRPHRRLDWRNRPAILGTSAHQLCGGYVGRRL